MTSPPLLAVFAHPNDESLSAGGLLARHAAQGGRAEVVTATWTSGTDRARELGEALRTLGAGEPRLLGYADAGRPESAPGAPRLCEADLDEAVGRLVAHIREVRPVDRGRRRHPQVADRPCRSNVCSIESLRGSHLLWTSMPPPLCGCSRRRC